VSDRAALLPAALSLATLVALLTDGSLGEIAFGLLAVLLPVALMAVAAPRSRSLRLLMPLLALVLAGSILAIRLLSGGAWVMFVGLGLVPFLLVVLGHARSFDDDG
jgi:hypothetical protein